MQVLENRSVKVIVSSFRLPKVNILSTASKSNEIEIAFRKIRSMSKDLFSGFFPI